MSELRRQAFGSVCVRAYEESSEPVVFTNNMKVHVGKQLIPQK